ncbi:MAG: L,D-transpeptidase family protein [Firmicutes bacterium]|nr:L,D-transpeptidase family protein [Bacillota bacterium]
MWRNRLGSRRLSGSNPGTAKVVRVSLAGLIIFPLFLGYLGTVAVSTEYWPSLLKPNNCVEETNVSTLLPMTALFAVRAQIEPVASRRRPGIPEPPPPPPDRFVLVDIGRLQLTLYKNGRPAIRYPIAAGRAGDPSPIGEWQIRNKFHAGGPYGTRWNGMNVPWGIFGIHGTNNPGSIGSYASGGCIRMYNQHQEALYPEIPVGTLVKMVGRDLQLYPRPSYHPGMAGQPIVLVQYQLRKLGFFPHVANARFDAVMEQEVRVLQTFYGLQEDGIIGPDVKTIAQIP